MKTALELMPEPTALIRRALAESRRLDRKGPAIPGAMELPEAMRVLGMQDMESARRALEHYPAHLVRDRQGSPEARICNFELIGKG